MKPRRGRYLPPCEEWPAYSVVIEWDPFYDDHDEFRQPEVGDDILVWSATQGKSQARSIREIVGQDDAGDWVVLTDFQKIYFNGKTAGQMLDTDLLDPDDTHVLPMEKLHPCEQISHPDVPPETRAQLWALWWSERAPPFYRDPATGEEFIYFSA